MIFQSLTENILPEEFLKEINGEISEKKPPRKDLQYESEELFTTPKGISGGFHEITLMKQSSGIFNEVLENGFGRMSTASFVENFRIIF